MSSNGKKIYQAPSTLETPKPKRNINVTFRLTEVEKEDWESKAETIGCGNNLSKFIRLSVENSSIRLAPPIPPINRQIYIELGRIGNNLNQIAKAINYSVKIGNPVTNDPCPDIEEVKLLLKEVQALLVGMPLESAPSEDDE
ncbi:hypothetical protein NIES2101_23385 [Calothrix sp. HK-06]|nr:hypothetical protein NIES2101_23385 [Calothrix sp. HK-06]